jgi:hypothetical protein
VGGGRTLRAKATKRLLAETGSARRVRMGTNLALSRFVLALGAAECAATQTVQLAASTPFAW